MSFALPQKTQDGSYFLRDDMIAVNVDFQSVLYFDAP